VDAITAFLENKSSSSRVSSIFPSVNQPSVQSPHAPSSCHLVGDRCSCGPHPLTACSCPLPMKSTQHQSPTRSLGRSFLPSTAYSSSLLETVQGWGRVWRWRTPQRWSACCGTGRWATLNLFERTYEAVFFNCAIVFDFLIYFETSFPGLGSAHIMDVESDCLEGSHMRWQHAVQRRRGRCRTS
jgi:hypothetical protein